MKNRAWPSPGCAVSALLLLLVGTALCARAQTDQWQKHMKAGAKHLGESDYAKFWDGYLYHGISYLPSPSDYVKAERQFLAALPEAQQFPAGDLRTAETLGNLANVYAEEGRFAQMQAQYLPLRKKRAAATRASSKFAEAEKAGNQAVAAMQAAVGPSDPRLGDTLVVLALVYHSESEPEQAAPIEKRALDVLRRAGGPADPLLIQTVVSRCDETWNGAVKGGELRQVCQFAVDLEDATVVSSGALSRSLYVLARYQRGAEAEQTDIRKLEVDERRVDLSPCVKGSVVADDFEELGALYLQEGRYLAASAVLQRSMDGMRTADQLPGKCAASPAKHGSALDAVGPIIAEAGPAAPVVLALLPFVALSGRHEEKAEEKAVEACQGSLPKPDPPALLGVERELAGAYAKTDRYQEAEQLYEHIVSGDHYYICEHWVGNIDLSQDLTSLAGVHSHEKRYADALDAIKQAQAANTALAEAKGKVKAKVPARDLVWTWYTNNRLAEVYREQGNTAEAEPFFLKSLDMVDNFRLGPGLPELAHLLDNYATLLRDEGKYDQAETFYKRALDTWAKNEYSDRPGTADTLTHYAQLLRKLNRAAEAEPLEARGAAIRAKLAAPSPIK
jgi:tetratricopeptide (TPR) repeat protein